MIEPIKTVKAQPVYFYDDRGKTKDFLVLVDVLYENEQVCLCTAKWQDPANLQDVDEEYANKVYTLLFDKESCEVHHKDWDSWYAIKEMF